MTLSEGWSKVSLKGSTSLPKKGVMQAFEMLAGRKDLSTRYGGIIKKRVENISRRSLEYLQNKVIS